MYDIIAILIPIVFAICIVVIIRMVTDARLRRRLAETHASESMVLTLLQADEENRRKASLKWGLVLMTLGTGCIVVDKLGLQVEDPSSFGLVFISIGLGMLIHHLVDRSRKPD